MKRHRSAKGFTLIELLMVIALIAALAGLLFAVGNGAKVKSRRDKTRAQIEHISQCLEAYKVEYGDYPEVANKSDNPTDMAKMLYQALSGDGSSMIEGGEGGAAKGEPGSGGKMFSDQVQRGNKTAGLVNDKEWMLIDPWGKPYQYMKGDPQKREVNNKNTFDLWSTGDDKTGKDDSKHLTNWGQ